MTLDEAAIEAVPEDLLAAYGPGRSYYTSPSGGLLTEGVRARLPVTGTAGDWATLAERAGELVASGGDPDAIVLGAVPFDHAQPAHLVVPETVHRAPPLSPQAVLRVDVPRVHEWRERHDLGPDGYARAVAEAVRRFAATELEKVVLARAVDVTVSSGIDVRAVLTSLAARDPGGYTFAIDVPAGPGGRRTFLGASPELLVRRAGDRIVAHPLAGSAARSADHREDRERAQALLQSAKERHEHAVVIDDVARLLRPFCRSLSVPPGPELVNTRSMWHLATRLEGVLADPSTSSLDVACALHPTPAVCGTPTDLAHDTIAELEPFDRGYYTGMVGWQDAAGDGEWVVTVRSAEIEGERLRLYAGAGIVDGSVPADEVRETSAKLRTLLDAVGIDAEL
ncbi:MAG: isochorismate synthase [Streptosporangiales bacterium]|nr:isochorismate synthase [Streptosporangiales bacterium]